MLANGLIIVATTVSFILWLRALQRKLVRLDENVGQAMTQIGMQLSSCFDVLAILLRLTKHYAPYESDALIEKMNARRRTITAKSIPADVLLQEKVITEVLEELAVLTTQQTELKENETFKKTMDAVQVYENMLRTSHLLYNDSVKKFNQRMQSLPVRLIARLLGFSKRAYLISEE